MKFGNVYSKGVNIIAWIALLSSYPYVFYLFIPIPPFEILLILTAGILIILGIIFKPTLSNLPKNIIILLICQCIIWLIFCIIHHDTSYFVRIIYLFITYILYISLNNTTKGIAGFYRTYNKWIMIMSIGGTIAFLTIIITGIPPLFEFTEQDGRPGYCFGLTTTNTWIGNIIRYSGLFDEPGQMAFWGMWALIFNLVFIKNMKLEKIIICCLIFTFSIAYYIQLFFYLIFFKIKKIKYAIIICVTALSVGVSIYILKDNYPVIYKFTFERLETNSSGGFQGDNRSNLATIARKAFHQNPIIGVGARNAVETMEYMGDNPYTLLAYDGIVGTINTYLPLLFILIQNFRRPFLVKALIILAIGYLQRPASVYLISPFIIYGFTILCYLKYHTPHEINCYHSLLQR